MGASMCKKRRTFHRAGGGSFVFFVQLHLVGDGITYESVQAFSLTGGEILDDLALTFFDDHIDPVVRFFVISGRGFLLRVIILRMFHKITLIYTNAIICKIE